ncbi:glutamine amidotransferase [Candidatus Dojkabacteria bacterium]|nr:glutamine amidotransferase [Candidatus Dojkabacteria bacterium]
MNLNLTIAHLYPKHLNLYGDIGNIICLERRCEWHGIDFQINNLGLEDKIEPSKTDIYFIGGGQDNDQILIVDDFHKTKYKTIQEDIENNTVLLGVCGGYQLIGHSFLMGDGKNTKGLGIIDIETKAPGKEVKNRCIGNLIAELDHDIYNEIKKIYTKDIKILHTLVGFENHWGQTYFTSDKVKPLANTIKGFGNNYSAKYEGARYRNVFGSYMHGSFLPKNPHFADYLIWLALVRKYNDRSIKLEPLDNKEEIQAHKYILDRYVK